MSNEEYNGSCVIRVRFHNNAEYRNFRQKVLKTDWKELNYPVYESLIREFHTFDDLQKITVLIVELLQLGFSVCTCEYKLNRYITTEFGIPTASETSPNVEE